MTAAKSAKKIVGIWAILCSLLISACFLMSLLLSQEVYAEKKKVSGTTKGDSRLGRTVFRIPDSKLHIFLNARHSVLNSADPDWNNARFFEVNCIDHSKPGHYRGYGVIYHPSGDQTFIEFETKIGSAKSTELTDEIKGFFIGGTGKYIGIRARWLSKAKWEHISEGRKAEWEVEYF